MTAEPDFFPSKADIEYAENFRVLNSLLKNCTGSENAALLLSTCRNAYLTANALFAELQVLLGDAVEFSALRGACELLIQGADGSRIKPRFGRAIQTVREFEHKWAVWEKRQEIWSDIDRAKKILEASNRLAPDRINLLLKSTRIDAQSVGNGWDYEVRAIDLQEQPQLGPSFAKLQHVFQILSASAELGWNVAKLLSPDKQPQLRLEDAKEDFDANTVAKEAVDRVRRLAKECNWVLSDTENELRIDLTGGYKRPQSTGVVGSVRLRLPLSGDAIRGAAQGVGVLIREALYFSHSELCVGFTPNVGRPPMPTPFVIELPMPVPLFDNGYGGRIELDRIRCTATDLPDDTLRIAIANLAVPAETEMSGRNYRLNDVAAQKVKADIRQALQIAASEGCRAVVFPEYSVPSSMSSDLMELAVHHNLVVIAGLEGEWIDDKLSDKAIVAIPGEDRPYFQRKQEPSLEEEVGEAFYRDGKILMFSNSPIGEFTVVICSDFMELANLQVWQPDGPLPELLFVVTRNKYPDPYLNFAKADAFRLYAGIVIANVRDHKDHATNEGSCVVVPKKDNQVLDGREVAVDGTFLKSVVTYDISLRAIRARSRGKPENGYFPVPRSAKRS